MKKILYTVLLGVLLYAGISAQSVMYYKFSHEQGSEYNALTGATSIDKTMTAPKDKFPFTVFNATESFDLTVKSDTMVAGIPLGFDFLYEGKTYDKFVVFGIGYIYLGEKNSEKVHVKVASTSIYDLWRMTPNTIGVSTRVQDTCRAAVQYKTEGETGSKTATVEFSMGYQGIAAATVFHYQVKLYEQGGKIEMLFDDFDVNWAREPFAVGISGMDGNTYYMDAKAGDFSDVVRSTNNGWIMLSALKFQKGLKYTFLPPDNCVAPDVTGATISAGAAGSAHVLLNLGVTENQADAYIVVASENPITENPADGTSYKVGDNLAGGKVLAVNEDWQDKTEFKVEHSDKYKNELKPDTKYYYAAWLYNYKCSGGVKYSTAPVKTEVTTRTAAPKALNFVSVNKTEIKLNMDADDAGSDVLVAVTNVHGHGNHVSIVLMQGNFGIPADNARVGDTIKDENGDFAGKVIYVGKAENAQITYPVTDNKIYHFGAFRKGADGQYSTLFASADTLTPAVIPFSEDFSNMIPYDFPIGWNATDKSNIRIERDMFLSFIMPEASGTAVVQDIILPPMDYPDKALRLVLDYNMTISDGFRGAESPLVRSKWKEEDSIVFEVSVDNGETYRPFYAITKNNADEFSSTSERLLRNITIKGFEGAEQALLRINWKSTQPIEESMNLYAVRIMEVPDCDYPISVSIDPATVVADEASVQWEPGESGESAWNISYALKNGSTWGEWSQAQQVSTNPFRLTDLASNSIYKVRVQSVCGVGQTSEWVESSEFTSGWVAPFVEDFNNVPVVGSGWMRYPTFPNGWNAFSAKHAPGAIGDTLKTADMGQASLSQSDVYYYNWKVVGNATPGSGNGSLAYAMYWSQGTTLLCLPTLRLDENDAADFVFNAAYGTYTYPAFSKVTRTDTAYKMYLFVSTDGGKNFAVKDAVKVWDSTALVAFGDGTAVRVDLSEYKGKEVVLALAVSSGVYNANVQNDILWIDNMGVVYPCGTAKSLKIENIEKTTASLTWKADPMVEEWIVKAVNTDTTTFTAVQQNSVVLQNLDSATYYTVYVGHLCGEDTSDWASVSFTTAGVQCDPISNLAVSEITRTTAKLSWNGDALRYRIRLRKAGSTDAYVVYNSENEEYSFTALLPGTEYEGGVQSICGEAAADTSAYVAFENFTTTAITCFAPTNLAASELTFHSAKLSWEGAAQNYQLAYRREATTAVLGSFMVSGKEYVLSGLDAVTPYEVRVRSICGEGDTSAYCDWVSFTTTTVPPCPAPADLKAENITINSAELSWTCSDAEAGFILRYRPSSATVWDSVKNLEQNKHLLNNLQPKTAYLWSVMATCSDNRASGWATASNFTTLEETAVENPLAAQLQVRAGKGQIYIYNPTSMPISRVRVLSSDGALLENYRVGGTDNVILTTSHSMRVVIVVVESGKQVMRYKVLLP